jgi:hypothetical protein
MVPLSAPFLSKVLKARLLCDFYRRSRTRMLIQSLHKPVNSGLWGPMENLRRNKHNGRGLDRIVTTMRHPGLSRDHSIFKRIVTIDLGKRDQGLILREKNTRNIIRNDDSPVTSRMLFYLRPERTLLGLDHR